MRRILIIVALAACTEPHDASHVSLSLDPGDCVTCHVATIPNALVHPEAKFSIAAQSSPHLEVDCDDCHNFGRGYGVLGLHVDCTNECHLRNDPSNACLEYPASMGTTPCGAIDPTHTDGMHDDPVTGAPYAWDAVNHDFCVQCHPSGLR